MIIGKIGLTALIGLLAAVVLAAPAFGAKAKMVYAENAEIGHKTGDPYTGAMNGVKSSATANFKFGTGTISCNQSTMNGKITDSGAVDGVINGAVEQMTFANNGGACVWSGGGNCTVTANNLPWGFTITIPVATAVYSVANARFTTNCGGGNCVYATEALVGTVSWNPAGISFNQSIPRVEGGFLCPTPTTFEVVYSATGQNDFGAATNIQVWSF